jgi:hypothetical protein
VPELAAYMRLSARTFGLGPARLCKRHRPSVKVTVYRQDGTAVSMAGECQALFELRSGTPMTDEQRRIAWLMAEHAALSSESEVVGLAAATQEPKLATLLVDAATLRRAADDLYQEIVGRISTCAARRQLH